MAVYRSLDAFTALARKFQPDADVVESKDLQGGVSADVTMIVTRDRSGEEKRYVIRCHGEVDRRRNRHIARDEYRLLTSLYQSGLPVPRPVFVGDSAAILGRPFIVTEFVEGSTEFTPGDVHTYLQQLADCLVQIHSVSIRERQLDFLPAAGETFPSEEAACHSGFDIEHVRRVLARHDRGETCSQKVLLHGDYWPGNILWKDEAIVAVIDWEDAAVGDPLRDLANTRLELNWAFGHDAMHEFTKQYHRRSSVSLQWLPVWDLRAAIRTTPLVDEWGLEPEIAARMRARQRAFIEQAMELLS
jgi:aminoglycoside phosphotransferase (APT) family kinase protein